MYIFVNKNSAPIHSQKNESAVGVSFPPTPQESLQLFLPLFFIPFLLSLSASLSFAKRCNARACIYDLRASSTTIIMHMGAAFTDDDYGPRVYLWKQQHRALNSLFSFTLHPQSPRDNALAKLCTPQLDQSSFFPWPRFFSTFSKFSMKKQNENLSFFVLFTSKFIVIDSRTWEKIL